MTKQNRIRTTGNLVIGSGLILFALLFLLISASGIREEMDPDVEEDSGREEGIPIFCGLGIIFFFCGSWLVYRAWNQLDSFDEPQYQDPGDQEEGREAGYHPGRYKFQDLIKREPARRVVIQNIQNYSVGSKVNIQNSVILDSELGDEEEQGKEPVTEDDRT